MTKEEDHRLDPPKQPSGFLEYDQAGEDSVYFSEEFEEDIEEDEEDGGELELDCSTSSLKFSADLPTSPSRSSDAAEGVTVVAAERRPLVAPPPSAVQENQWKNMVLDAPSEWTEDGTDDARQEETQYECNASGEGSGVDRGAQKSSVITPFSINATGGTDGGLSKVQEDPSAEDGGGIKPPEVGTSVPDTQPSSDALPSETPPPVSAVATEESMPEEMNAEPPSQSDEHEEHDREPHVEEDEQGNSARGAEEGQGGAAQMEREPGPTEDATQTQQQDQGNGVGAVEDEQRAGDGAEARAAEEAKKDEEAATVEERADERASRATAPPAGEPPLLPMQEADGPPPVARMDSMEVHYEKSWTDEGSDHAYFDEPGEDPWMAHADNGDGGSGMDWDERRGAAQGGQAARHDVAASSGSEVGSGRGRERQGQRDRRDVRGTRVAGGREEGRGVELGGGGRGERSEVTTSEELWGGECRDGGTFITAGDDGDTMQWEGGDEGVGWTGEEEWATPARYQDSGVRQYSQYSTPQSQRKRASGRGVQRVKRRDEEGAERLALQASLRRELEEAVDMLHPPLAADAISRAELYGGSPYASPIRSPQEAEVDAYGQSVLQRRGHPDVDPVDVRTPERMAPGRYDAHLPYEGHVTPPSSAAPQHARHPSDYMSGGGQGGDESPSRRSPYLRTTPEPRFEESGQYGSPNASAWSGGADSPNGSTRGYPRSPGGLDNERQEASAGRRTPTPVEGGWRDGGRGSGPLPVVAERNEEALLQDEKMVYSPDSPKQLQHRQRSSIMQVLSKAAIAKKEASLFLYSATARNGKLDKIMTRLRTLSDKRAGVYTVNPAVAGQYMHRKRPASAGGMALSAGYGSAISSYARPSSGRHTSLGFDDGRYDVLDQPLTRSALRSSSSFSGSAASAPWAEDDGVAAAARDLSQRDWLDAELGRSWTLRGPREGSQDEWEPVTMNRNKGGVLVFNRPPFASSSPRFKTGLLHRSDLWAHATHGVEPSMVRPRSALGLQRSSSSMSASSNKTLLYSILSTATKAEESGELQQERGEPADDLLEEREMRHLQRRARELQSLLSGHSPWWTPQGLHAYEVSHFRNGSRGNDGPRRDLTVQYEGSRRGITRLSEQRPPDRPRSALGAYSKYSGPRGADTRREYSFG